MASKGKQLSELLDAGGDVRLTNLDNVNTAVVGDLSPQLGGDLDGNGNTIDLSSSTDALGLPTGTTAQRPGSPSTGYTRMNTTTGSVEFYDGTAWVATNLIPLVDSVSGNINDGFQTTITLNLSNVTDTVTVRFTHSGTNYDVAGVDTTGASITANTPSGLVSAVSGGDTVAIRVLNDDGTISNNSQTITAVAAPSGGTVTTSGNYRIHTFTSSGSFVNGFSSLSADFLVIAGGGGGGSGQGGGGGAGGYRTSAGTSGRNSSAESALSLSAATYTVTVGGGGLGRQAGDGDGVQGTDSEISGSGITTITSIGGGHGTGYRRVGSPAGHNGGSGGGGNGDNSNPGGSGTAGQGFDGGNGGSTSGGGGGAAANGNNASGSTTGQAGHGGSGLASSITGSSVTRAGGGGGGVAAGGSAGNGGSGGGGLGGIRNTRVGANATANTGSGGGGNDGGDLAGNGGSGLVVIRYDVTTV